MPLIRQLSCFDPVAILLSCIVSLAFMAAQNTAELEHMRTRAQKGCVDDELKLAYAFQSGSGTASNATEAAKWFLKAANHAMQNPNRPWFR